jgi:4-hydroxythreonine-4-phosphate dehydrogenase
MKASNMPARLGLLLGDPTGIGPEVVAKVLTRPDAHEHAELVVIGDRRVLEMGQKVAGVNLAARVVTRVEELDPAGRGLQVLDVPGPSPGEFTLGQLSAKAGKSVLEALSFALDLAQAGQLDAIVFAPLNKQAMHMGGSPYPDELHFFADRLQWRGLLGELNVLENLWTSRATSHVGLREVSALITKQRVYEAIVLIDGAMRLAGLATPRLAVAALNPHGGEGGLFGTEEIDVIAPAIAQARSEGIDASGPFPADTIFVRVTAGAYNGVVSMYHDQGQIAMKLMGFERGVTVQGGLPIPITTPAHGTAFDIAGKGVANPEALRQAFLLACRMAANLRAKRPHPTNEPPA